MERVNRVWLGTIAAAAMVAVGCASKPKPQGPSAVHVPPERTLNSDLVEINFSQQNHKGAVIGRTVYPHHFVPDSSELNMIGERQVDDLIPASLEQPLEINVMRGDASDTLYQARLETVRTRFIRSGVAAERIAFADKLPGGDGISSERTIRLAAQEQKRADQSNRGGGGSYGQSGNGSIRGESGMSGSSGSGGGSSGGGGGSSGGGGGGGGY